MKFRPRLLGLLGGAILACGGGGNATGPPGDGGPPPADVGLEIIAQGLDFPVWLVSPPGDPRLFVVEKGGRILIVSDGVVLVRVTPCCVEGPGPRSPRRARPG